MLFDINTPIGLMNARNIIFVNEQEGLAMQQATKGHQTEYILRKTYKLDNNTEVFPESKNLEVKEFINYLPGYR